MLPLDSTCVRGFSMVAKLLRDSSCSWAVSEEDTTASEEDTTASEEDTTASEEGKAVSEEDTTDMRMVAFVDSMTVAYRLYSVGLC